MPTSPILGLNLQILDVNPSKRDCESDSDQDQNENVKNLPPFFPTRDDHFGRSFYLPRQGIAARYLDGKSWSLDWPYIGCIPAMALPGRSTSLRWRKGSR